MSESQSGCRKEVSYLRAEAHTQVLSQLMKALSSQAEATASREQPERVQAVRICTSPLQLPCFQMSRALLSTLFASPAATDGRPQPRSPHCLFTEQTLAYQIIYILHYVGLAWNFAHWVMDGFHLWPGPQTSWHKEAKAVGSRCGKKLVRYQTACATSYTSGRGHGNLRRESR